MLNCIQFTKRNAEVFKSHKTLHNGSEQREPIKNAHARNEAFDWFPPMVAANSCWENCIVFRGFNWLNWNIRILLCNPSLPTQVIKKYKINDSN